MMSTGTPDIGLAGGSSTLDFYNNNFHSTHFNGYRLDAQAAQTATGYDGVSSEILLEPGQKVGIAWSDSTSAITSGANNGAAMIVATKDHSNTSMAHIIKPAVAIGKGMFANGTNEGSSGNGTYAQRKLNVWTGDTWFVSGFDGTLGPGGQPINLILTLELTRFMAILLHISLTALLVFAEYRQFNRNLWRKWSPW